MKKKVFAFGFSIISCLTLAGVIIFTSLGNNRYSMVRGLDEPMTLDLNRSITSDEISAGQASFNTAKNNPIVFKFSSASTDSGLISLASGGEFYNDTQITGISKIELTLASGSANLCYGNAKDDLYLGLSELSGTSPITVNFDTPSDYFKICDVSGPLAISSLRLTYQCANSYDPSKASVTYSSGTSYQEFNLENWATSQKSIVFMFKKVTADATGLFKIRLCDAGKNALGYVVQVTLNADSVSAGSPANTEYVADGWYRFMLDTALLSKQAGKDGTETMKYLQVADVSTPVKIALVTAESMFKPRVGTRYDLPTTIYSYKTSNSYLTFKVKKVNPSETGKVEFKLSDGTNDSYGIRFNFVADGAPTNDRACASIEDIGGGWYLITTQTGSQITGSAFDASKLLCNNYAGQKDFYLKDLAVH